MFDDTNRTTNSRWHLAHNIRQTVSQMGQHQKEQCLVRIQTELLQAKTPDPKILKYVTTLLNGKEPKKGIGK